MTARGVRAGRAYVSVDADLNPIEKRLKQISARFEALGSRISSIGRSVASIGAGAVALGGTVGGALAVAVNEAGDFAEILSKFETVFGDQTTAVRSWANEYGKAVGRSESQLLRFLGNAQDTFVPLGFNAREAQAFSKQLTTLAIDLASFNNQTDDEAFNRLLSAVVGNTENLRAFGVVAQDAQIKAKALQLGFDPKTLSAYQKAQVVMRLAIEGTTAAQGDALKTAGSYANRVKALGASFANLKASIGAPLLDPIAKVLAVVSRIVEITSTWAKANARVIQTVAAISLAVTGIGAALITAGVATIGLGLAISSMGTIISSAFAVATTVLSGVTTAIAAIATPVGLVTAAVAGLGIYIGYVALSSTGALAKLSEAFQSLGSTALTAWGGIVSAVSTGDLETAGQIAFTALEVGWLTVTTTIQSVWARLSDFFVNTWLNAVESIVQIGAQIYTGVASTFDKLGVALINGFDTAFVYITGAIDSIQTAIAKAIVKAQQFFGLFSESQSIEIQQTLDQNLQKRADGRESGIGRRFGERQRGLNDRQSQRESDAQQFSEIVSEDFERRRTTVDDSGLTDAQKRLEELKLKLSTQASEAQEKAAKAQVESEGAQRAEGARLGAVDALSSSAGSVGTFVSGVASQIAGGGTSPLETLGQQQVDLLGAIDGRLAAGNREGVLQ